MHINTHKIFFSLILVCFIVLIKTQAQTASFHHINTSDGLSENNVRSVVVDKNGFLWIGTINGLNVYDGYTVTSYKKEDKPQIASNNIIHLTCDHNNRIWLGSSEGITWLDEKRNFHRVILEDTVSRFACRTIMETKTYGPVLYTSLGQFYFDERTRAWTKLDWIPNEIAYEKFHDAEPFDEDKIIYATDSIVMILDYAIRKIIYEQPFTAAFSLCRYSDHEVAVGLEHGLVQIADIHTKQIVKQYRLTSELNKKKINSTITEVRLASNGNLLVATGYAGLVIIDREGNITRYTHDPIDPSSIGSNLIWRVLSTNSGDIIVGTSVAGVSIFNIYNREAGFIHLFSDGEGDFYDNYVSKMAEDKHGVLWIGALERLIRWDKNNNRVKFFYYFSPPIWNGAQNLEIRAVCIDKLGRTWISALGEGIAILNEATGSFKKIIRDTSLGAALKSPFVVELYTASDGTIWAGSTTGMYTINPVTLKTHVFDEHPVLKQVGNTRVNAFFEDVKGCMWMATYNGVYCYNRLTNHLDHFTTKEGLVSDQCFTLSSDNKGKIYVCTTEGFSVISEGKIYSYNRTNGLKYNHCEGVLQDKEGKLWIANYKCIIRLDPETGAMQYFDKGAGLATDGFRMGSYLKTQTGELIWGNRAGINYFYPQQLINHPSDFKVNIYRANIRDSGFYVSGNDSVSLPYRNNNIIFRFTAISLKGSHNIQYQYMLEGYDKQWQKGTDVREARYSSLHPGQYTFKVKASIEGIYWTNSSNTIKLCIIPPVWQQWWFITISAVAVAVIIYLLVHNRRRKLYIQQEELEIEKGINYFASSMYEQQTIENILWDVAKNCIGRLHFEDCVIYLLDKERNVLIQKAAHGPKSPTHFEIAQPIEIPLGKGIVGSVAANGRAEIVNDTTKDARYIVDDQQRFSEITVPIISNGEVLGVIDCEHSKKRFFTQKHLSILTTIASLCANKIVRTKAEEEKEHAQLKLMDTQRKMTEVEMQALRAQMNPHFIFNCLNSINRYIVKSDQATASLYLTKFAKLIRLILDNSNNKNVILSHELEALKLYIEMEALRFDKKFMYCITVDDDVNTDSIEVPPLIIQPYVENAIWHGLLHKETPGCLHISISMPEENVLQCVIEDDGVGREKAKELKSKSATTRKSLGLKLTENRLTLLNKYAELSASIDIIDLKTDDNVAAGTKVILKIPVQW